MGDIAIPDEIAAWMKARGWEDHHDEWHFERNWDYTEAEAADGNLEAKEQMDYARSKGWKRADNQEGALGNGLEFLAMHRAMIILLLTNFPRHGHLFRGWETPPLRNVDPGDPVLADPKRLATWHFNPDKALGIARIEQAPGSFETDDELGLFIETPLKPTAADPRARNDNRQTGIHNYLHGRWEKLSDELDLGDPKKNIFNRRFWKLHGWIDFRWSLYRESTGKSDDEPSYAEAVLAYLKMMDMPMVHLHAAMAAPVVERPRPSWAFRI